MKFNDGIATAEDIRVEGPAARLTLTGTASVPSREYDLKGVASLTSAPSSDNGFDLPFVVQGPWDDPLVFPDPDSLIRRSPGAAQLLELAEGQQGPRRREIGARTLYRRRRAASSAQCCGTCTRQRAGGDRGSQAELTFPS